MEHVAIADRDHEQHQHDPQTFISKYIWSQDHKVIAIQYSRSVWSRSGLAWLCAYNWVSRIRFRSFPRMSITRRSPCTA